VLFIELIISAESDSALEFSSNSSSSVTFE